MITLEQENNKSYDKRLENAQHIEKMMKTKGWELFFNELSMMRDEAKANFMVNHMTEGLKQNKWQCRMIAIDECMSIPELFLIKGRNKLKEGMDGDVG